MLDCTDLRAYLAFVIDCACPNVLAFENIMCSLSTCLVMYMTQLLSTRHRFSLLLMAPTVTVAHTNPQTHTHIDRYMSCIVATSRVSFVHLHCFIFNINLYCCCCCCAMWVKNTHTCRYTPHDQGELVSRYCWPPDTLNNDNNHHPIEGQQQQQQQPQQPQPQRE